MLFDFFMDGSFTGSNTEWRETGELQWPLAHSFTITSPFGLRIDPITGEEDFHTEIDISALEATPILAAADGVVIHANSSDPWDGSYGYYVRLQHDGGIETFYAHCLDICVGFGQEVRQGEIIGFVGNTGNSMGPHLHFEVRAEDGKVDPLDFFEPVIREETTGFLLKSPVYFMTGIKNIPLLKFPRRFIRGIES